MGIEQIGSIGKKILGKLEEIHSLKLITKNKVALLLWIFSFLQSCTQNPQELERKLSQVNSNNSPSLEKAKKNFNLKISHIITHWWDTKKLEEQIKILDEIDELVQEYQNLKLPDEWNENLSKLITSIPDCIKNNWNLKKIKENIKNELEKQKSCLKDNFMNIPSYSIRDMVEKNINFTWSIDDLFYNNFFDVFTREYANFMLKKWYSLKDLDKDKGLDITAYELRKIVQKCAKSLSDDKIWEKTIKVKLKNQEVELPLISLKFSIAVNKLSNHTMQQNSIRSFYVELDWKYYIIEIDKNDKIVKIFDENNKPMSNDNEDFQVILLKNWKKAVVTKEREKARNGANTEYKITKNGKKSIILAEGYKNSQWEKLYQTPFTEEINTEKLRQEWLNFLTDLVIQAQTELKKNEITVNNETIIKAIIISIIEHIDWDRKLSDEEFGKQMNEVLCIIWANGAHAYEYAHSSAWAKGLPQVMPWTYENLKDNHPKAHLPKLENLWEHSQNKIMQATLLHIKDAWERFKIRCKQNGNPTSASRVKDLFIISDYNWGTIADSTLQKYLENGSDFEQLINNKENQLYVWKYKTLVKISGKEIRKKIEERRKYFKNFKGNQSQAKKSQNPPKKISNSSQETEITQTDIQNLKKKYPNLAWNSESKKRENARIKALEKEKKITQLKNYNMWNLKKSWDLEKITDTNYYKINESGVDETRRYLPKSTKKILETIAQKFNEKFKKPLIINSLARTQEYQNKLSESNVNATKSISAHTFWIAFDFQIMYMTPEELDFLCQIVLEMEKEWKINAILEWKWSVCLHITDLKRW